MSKFPMRELLQYFCPSNVFITLVASIPVILLSLSKSLRLSQKLRILFFLTLNLVIVAFCLVRSIGGRYYAPGTNYVQFSVPWIQFYHEMEAVVAVLMGCITAMRTVFAPSSGINSHGSSIYVRIKKFLHLSTGGEDDDEKYNGSETHKTEPKFLGGLRTGATFNGLRTFIRRYDREPGQTTIGNSQLSMTVDPVEEYHNFQRGHARVDSRETENSRDFRTATPETGSRSSTTTGMDVLQLFFSLGWQLTIPQLL
jgi:hypothetical protein